MFRSLFFVSILFITIALGVMLMIPARLSAQEPDPTETVSAQTDDWLVHLYASPGSDGLGLWAFTGKVADICEEVEFIADRGSPAPFDGEYSPGEGIYSGFHNNFFIDTTDIQSGTLEVRCTLPEGEILDTEAIEFKRYYYANDNSPAPVPVDSPDNGKASLNLFSTSLYAPHYIIVMTTNALPGALPSDVKSVGFPYSFRSFITTFDSDNPMSLAIGSSDIELGTVNPLTLRIFEWNVDRWIRSDQYSVTTFESLPRLNRATTKFTTYILGGTPHWLDSFTSELGIGAKNNIKPILNSGGRLKLEDVGLLTGTLTSKPYTPTLPLKSWKSISYTANVPPGTGLTVSVLSRDGAVLIDQASPGQSLTDLDPSLYPSLKLRVEMTTTIATSPELFDWCLLAEPAGYGVYLPVVVKA